MRWNTPDFYLKSRDEMMELFGELEDALDRTWEIAQRCHVKLEKVAGPVPAVSTSRRSTRPIPTSNTSRGRDSRSGGRAWRRCARKGALKHDLAEYAERLDREIKMIQKMKFSGYFLIVWDFIRYAKRTGFRWVRAAVRRPAAWSATRWRSPISTRCSTGCCSSAS